MSCFRNRYIIVDEFAPSNIPASESPGVAQSGTARTPYQRREQNDSTSVRDALRKNKPSISPFKAFFQRVSRKLTRKANNEKEVMISSPSHSPDASPDSPPSTDLESRVRAEIVARTTADVKLAEDCQSTLLQAPTRVSVNREAILEGLADKRRVETSGARPKRREATVASDHEDGPVVRTPPPGLRNGKHNVAVPVSTRSPPVPHGTPPSKTASMIVFSSKAQQTTGSSPLTERRHTLHLAPLSPQPVSPENDEAESPSSMSSSSSFGVPSDSQLRAMEAALCTTLGSNKPAPAPRRQFVHRPPPLHIPATASISPPVVSEPNAQQVHSYRGSDDCPDGGKAASFSDSGYALTLPDFAETRSGELLPSSSSSFLVPSDSQMRVMEELLSGKMLASPAPSLDLAKANETGCIVTSVTALHMPQDSDTASTASSEIVVPSDAEMRAMELAFMSTGSRSSSSEDGSNSAASSCADSTNLLLVPLAMGHMDLEEAMIAAAGLAATARRSAMRSLRPVGGEPKRSAIRKEPEIVEVDRITGLPVKSDWREVHFPDEELVEVAIIPREPATVDMSYIVPHPAPVQPTPDRVFLNTPSLMPRTDVPGMQIDRVYPIMNITSPRPGILPPAPYRSVPGDRKGSLLPEPKVESPTDGTPRRSPWSNHNRFFDYNARVRSDPYTLGQHKELVLWRNRHRFGRRTSVYLPGTPFIIRDSKNVLKRASQALEDHICRLGLNTSREPPARTPVRSHIAHNAHFLRHTEAEDCPCGKSRKLRRLDGLFKPTNVSAYAITEASREAETGLNDFGSHSNYEDFSTNTANIARRRGPPKVLIDPLLECGAYYARQSAHPVVTDYAHLYDLKPRLANFHAAPRSSASGINSAADSSTAPGTSPDLSRAELSIPKVIITLPSSVSLECTTAGSSKKLQSDPRPACADPASSRLAVTGSRKTPQEETFAARRNIMASHVNHARKQGQPDISYRKLHYRPEMGKNPADLASNAASLGVQAVDPLRMPSLSPDCGSGSIPFLKAVTTRALFLPKPSLVDLSPGHS